MPWHIQIGWDDVPHLSEEEKAKRLASIPPYQRDARSKGVPRLGAGAIYPMLEEDILVPPLTKVPPWWMHAYGLDVGWNWTGAVRAVKDPQNDIIYIVADYKRSAAEPAVHAAAINAWGKWMRGAIDPASRGRQQGDGEKLLVKYQASGLNLEMAENAVEAGIYECWERFTEGRLKICTNCQWAMQEWRLYHRNEKGLIVKVNDHVMDAIRYVVNTDSVWQVHHSLTQGPRRSIGAMGTTSVRR